MAFTRKNAIDVLRNAFTKEQLEFYYSWGDLAIEQKRIKVNTFHPSLYFQDVFNNTSNLRTLKGAINHTTECLVSQQHVVGDTWHYIIIIVIALIAVIILFIALT